MYVTIKRQDPPNLIAAAVDKQLNFNQPLAEIREWMSPENIAPFISDFEGIAEHNKVMKRIIEEKDIGKPGHYYGRDMMVEGAMPLAAFLATHIEYEGDEKWYKDDRKFQDFMRRNPVYNWLTR